MSDTEDRWPDSEGGPPRWPDSEGGPPRPLSSREAAAFRHRSDFDDGLDSLGVPAYHAPPPLDTGRGRPAPDGDRRGGPSPLRDRRGGPATAAWVVGVLALLACVGVGLLYLSSADGNEIAADTTESAVTPGSTTTGRTAATTAESTTVPPDTAPVNTLSGRISGEQIEVVGEVPSTQAAAALKLLLEQVAGVGNVDTGAVVVSAGVPTPTRIEVIVDSELVFPTASDVIQDEFLPTLDRLAALMRANVGVTAVVEGHADSRGNAAINLSLSKRRADAVVAYLESEGIESTRLTPLGKGATEPIGDNATEAGRRQNRRIEFSIHGFRLDL